MSARSADAVAFIEDLLRPVNRWAHLVVSRGVDLPEPVSTSVGTCGAEQLYADMWPGMVRLGHLLTGSVPDGEDLAQEAYLGLLRAWPVEHPHAYVRTAIVNLAINAGRRRRRSDPRPDPLTAIAQPVPPDDTWPFVQRLPPRQRAVIVLRYYLDLSEADIATTLGCRPGTVKAHASKALARLRKELS